MLNEIKPLKDRIYKLEKIVSNLAQEVQLLRKSNSTIRESVGSVKDKILRVSRNNS